MSIMGRPAVFKDADELQTAVDGYFDNLNGKRATITGLAYHLGFESRQSFYDYEKHDNFSYIIKRARLKVESGYEENLTSVACTGSIFALKNMGWRDKTETGFTDKDGKDITPAIQLLPAQNCEPIKPEE